MPALRYTLAQLVHGITTMHTKLSPETSRLYLPAGKYMSTHSAVFHSCLQMERPASYVHVNMFC